MNRTKLNRQGGFTLIEILIAIVIVGALVIVGARSVEKNQGSGRVIEAVMQVQQVIGAVHEWAPRAGIYTGVNIEDLIEHGYLTVPRNTDGSQVAATEMNPWKGGVMVYVNTGQPTAFDIQVSGINRPSEAHQLATRLRQFGTNVTDTGSIVTVTVGAAVN